MTRTVIVALCLALLPAGALGNEYKDAEEASALLAAVKGCKTQISQEVRKVLYARLLLIAKTPSQVNFRIRYQEEEIAKMPAADRQVVCEILQEKLAEQ